MNRKQKSPKRKWVQPKLIITCRGKPEENVLLFCKTGMEGQGPDAFLFACLLSNQGGLCEQWTTS